MPASARAFLFKRAPEGDLSYKVKGKLPGYTGEFQTLYLAVIRLR